VITADDMVRAERSFVNELGTYRLAAVADGSLSGLRALEGVPAHTLLKGFSSQWLDIRRFLAGAGAGQ
jgi:hypothetical protein